MFFYNSSVKFRTKKFRSHNITVLYPNQCYNEVSYKGNVLYLSLRPEFFYKLIYGNFFSDIGWGGGAKKNK